MCIDATQRYEPAKASGIRLVTALAAIALGLALVWAGNRADQNSRPTQVPDPYSATTAEEQRQSLNALNEAAKPREDKFTVLIWTGWGIVALTIIVMVVGVVGEAGRKASAGRSAA